MTAIHLENLVKKFGNFMALKTMDLHIPDGEFMALLGPSGCGKSTTMNMIAGLEDPTSGRIKFGTRDMANVPLGERGVGFVFQNYAIFTHMTVRANLAYGLKMRGVRAEELDRRVKAMADFLQLTTLLDRKADKLSVNVLQRVAIGRSAILEPAIFLLDEPLSNVDAAFRAVMRTELKQLQRQFKQTMVYVTHDQLEAMTMADRIAIMDHGVLQQVGTPLEIYNNPTNIFVARFIGSPGMNLLKGSVVKKGTDFCVDLGAVGMTPPLPTDLAQAVRNGPAEVYYGFRPESVEIVTIQKKSALKLAVSFVERIGARTIIHMGTQEAEIKAIFDNDTKVELGDMISFAPAPETLRLFDAASGEAITTVRHHG